MEEKIKQAQEKVKNLLDKNNMRITSIDSRYNEKTLIPDKEERDAIIVSFYEPVLHKKHRAILDPNTLEVLFVKTGFMHFTKPEEYFQPVDDDYYEL